MGESLHYEMEEQLHALTPWVVGWSLFLFSLDLEGYLSYLWREDPLVPAGGRYFS